MSFNGDDGDIKARKRRRQQVYYQMLDWSLIVWRIVFAAVAIIDFLSCFDVAYEGWTRIGRKETASATTVGNDSKYGVCPAVSNVSITTASSSSAAAAAATTSENISASWWTTSSNQIRQSTCQAIMYVQSQRYWIINSVWSYRIHILFSLMCLIEMMIRAWEAHRLAVENHAIAKFETSLSRVYSTTRMMYTSTFRKSSKRALQQHQEEEEEKEDERATQHDQPSSSQTPSRPSSMYRRFIQVQPEDMLLARSTLRLWIPVGVTCFFWLSLLPRFWKQQQQQQGFGKQEDEVLFRSCGKDTAVFTEWMNHWFITTSVWLVRLQDDINTHVWEHIVMPYNFISQPRRFWKRVRHLLRAIKFIRFAGPFIRMSVKLWDQFYALLKTWRQSWLVKIEKEKRIRRPSLLWQDLQRIESLAKVQTALATLPSQIFDMVQEHLPARAAANSQHMLQQQQQHGRYIRRQLKNLRRELNKSLTKFSSADLYDKVIKLSHDIQNSHNRQQQKMVRFWNSRNYLISPRSRFSVMWRITVTNCLLLEMTRLAISWHLTKTFQLSITQVISRLFIHCVDPKDTQHHLRFITDRIDHIHRALANAIPLIPTHQEKFVLCVPTSLSATLLLQLGYMIQTFIDMVTFLDIFFWFFTGDLDGSGLVIPKAFFYRCILPGTVVQVLDHPTLPELLPRLIKRISSAAAMTGWSRTLRWIFAIGPALQLLIIQPMTLYFFRHFEESMDGNLTNSTNDLLMSYAESFGYLPHRPSIHGSSNKNLTMLTSDRKRNTSGTGIEEISMIQATDDNPSLASSPIRSQPILKLKRTPTTTTTSSSTMSNGSEFYSPIDNDDNDVDVLGDGIDFDDDDDDAVGGRIAYKLMKDGNKNNVNSSVRFARNVTILDRLDSVDTSGASYYEDTVDLHGDDSNNDIGYNLSSRDLQGFT